MIIIMLSRMLLNNLLIAFSIQP